MTPAPITGREWRAILSLSHKTQPLARSAINTKQYVLDSLITKGFVMRDQATHLSHKPYRYWLSNKGIRVRRLLK